MFTVLIGGHVCEVQTPRRPLLFAPPPAAPPLRMGWGAGCVSGEGRVVGACRAGSVVAGRCGSPRRAHEEP
eukprot:scaffold140576_cov99-Phaeocystis_antarctica.AAC.1